MRLARRTGGRVADGRRVLITGIAGQLAGMVARALERRDDVREIIGIDVREPPHDLVRTEFVRADIRNPLVARVLTASEVDTVVHLSPTALRPPDGGRDGMKERNVIGAMQLFAACQRAPAVRRLVLRSTSAVYGSEHTDPALFRESDAPTTPPRHGFAKDAAEIESYARALRRRRTDLDLTVLRFANLIGGSIDSAFHSLFSLPVVPTVLGYDPRLQFLHEHDAVEVLVEATTGRASGTYNVAGSGVLYLSQAVRLAGRVPVSVPLPFVSGVAAAVRRTRRVEVSPDQLRFLQFGRAVDTTRLRERFGYQPHYTTRAAFEDYVAHRRVRGLIDRDEVARFEREIHDFLQRRAHERRAAAPQPGSPS